MRHKRVNGLVKALILAAVTPSKENKEQAKAFLREESPQFKAVWHAVKNEFEDIKDRFENKPAEALEALTQTMRGYSGLSWDKLENMETTKQLPGRDYTL